MRTLLIILVLTIPIVVSSQEPSLGKLFQGTIVDMDTDEPLPYATIYNKSQQSGTASSEQGKFNLPNNKFGDSLIISYIGYSDLNMIYTEKMPTIIKLGKASTALDEVVITATSDYLYDVLKKLRSSKRSKSKSAKTYFFLESKRQGQTVEMIETYFQGTFGNCSLQKLDMKKGRIGLKPIGNRFFYSTETSRVFAGHNIFKQSFLFPSNPLCYNKPKMKKSYWLSLNNKYNSPEGKIIVIDFEPNQKYINKKTISLFRGTVWVNTDKNQIVKIFLKTEESKKHPFKPIGFGHINYASMEINKTFTEYEEEAFIDAIDFNYEISYIDNLNQPSLVITYAYLKAYNYIESFRLPKFQFSDLLHEDYRNITAVPYDEEFWSNCYEFRLFEQEDRIEKFIGSDPLEHEFTFSDNPRSCLQYRYVNWSPKRFDMHQSGRDPLTVENFRNLGAYYEDLYNFNRKLYLDINECTDTLDYEIYSVLDPVDSYFKMPVTPNAKAFANMYFDLVEIEKRNLEEQLSKIENPDADIVVELYLKSQQQINEQGALFRKDCLRGQKMSGMKKWNSIIEEELGINNLKVFELID